MDRLHRAFQETFQCINRRRIAGLVRLDWNSGRLVNDDQTIIAMHDPRTPVDRSHAFSSGQDVGYTDGMILPIGDDNRDRRLTPWVTYVFLGVNILVFLVLQQTGRNWQFTYSYSAVPQEILSGTDLVTESRVYADPITGTQYLVPGLGRTPMVYFTLITSLFMHGGWAHLLGNMLYLFIFGDNIEDRLGHGRFVVFYLLSGVAATFAHIWFVSATSVDLTTPLLGASGAISAVLGAYLVLFPKNRVRVILLRILMRVPAWVAILVWFAFQLVSGAGLLGAGSQAGGVAYAAHIGGFVFGALAGLVFAPRRQRDNRRRI